MTPRVPKERGLIGALAAIVADRTVINSGYRMVYPFVTVIARGAGIPLEQVTLTVTARSFLGLLSPLLGVIADRWGRRKAMLLGAACFISGGFVAGLWPGFPGLMLGILILTLGKLIFDPAMHAFLGDQVAYDRRGTAIAIAEMSWSGAFFVGMPLAGWIIAQSSWNIPFIAMGALAIPFTAWMVRAIPDDPVEVQQHRGLSFRKTLSLIVAKKGAIAGVMVGLLISLANEVINIIFGAWLDLSFGLEVVALGAATSVIGFAELGGESLVAVISDRLGKKRSVMLGIGANIAASLLLPVLGVTTAGALMGLFLLFITFEFSLVASIPLLSEVLPEARATLLALNISGLSAGRMLGSLAGPALFTEGIWMNGIAAALFNVAAIYFLSRVRVDGEK